MCQRKYMTSFREFYTQPGAASNFIAGKCLWTEQAEVQHGQDTEIDVPTNEFYFQREKLWNSDEVHSTGNFGIKLFDLFDPPIEIVVETKIIKPLLIELHEYMDDGDVQRPIVIENIEHLWKGDWSMHTFGCFDTLFTESSLDDERYLYLKTRIQNYLAMCREYYFKLCEENNLNSYIITHWSPNETYSPRLKLPRDFKSLGMELDEKTYLITQRLNQIKSTDTDDREINRDGIPYLLKLANRCLDFCDETVSYRKIFLDNDGDEIRKMYVFFGNEKHFDMNRSTIEKEFKEYNDNNIAVLEKNYEFI